jgi:UDP-GlcNAc3NAcA epimerase
MKIVSIVGARPQFIKCAVVSHALTRLAGDVEQILLHTGQHYDSNMSEIFFRDLDLSPPQYNLGVGSGSHGAQTGQMLEGIEQVLQQQRPDGVVVYGDTNSTLAGALAAAKLCIPVAHVEAGMRSFDRRAPEEINRVVTDRLASLLLCPTPVAMHNLAIEGIASGVRLVGNVMYDALMDTIERAEQTSSVLRRLGLSSGNYFLVTVHRAENTDAPGRLRSILTALDELSRVQTVVWPVHPRTRRALQSVRALTPPGEFAAGAPSLREVEPMSYPDMLVLEKHARAILTDSGGVTTEAFWLRVPCITLREETEWPETVASGWNTLVGSDPRRIVDSALRSEVPRAAVAAEPGGASARIAEALVGWDFRMRG